MAMNAEPNVFPPLRRRILQAVVDSVSPDEARRRVLAWARRRESRSVVCANVHVVTEAVAESAFARLLERADLVTPDGWPVAWLMRQLYGEAQARVSGPELMWSLLAECGALGIPVFLYGSTENTLQKLVAEIRRAFPALTIAGAESPPFGPMTGPDLRAAAQRIAASGAGIVFVGLGCPRQERWIALQRGRIPAVMLGVGAAFDFHAGTLARAPRWMRESGLEWLYRLLREPTRLWRRYLVANTAFLLGALSQVVARGLPRA